MQDMLVGLLCLRFNLIWVDSPPLCGEEDKVQSESLGSGADLLPYPVRLRRGPLINLYKEQQVFLSLSCVAQGFPVLGRIASRHFRTPIIPAYWQVSVREPILPEQSIEVSTVSLLESLESL